MYGVRPQCMTTAFPVWAMICVTLESSVLLSYLHITSIKSTSSAEDTLMSTARWGSIHKHKHLSNGLFSPLNFQVCTEAALSVDLFFSVYLKRSSNFPWSFYIYNTSLCYKKYCKFLNSSASLLVQKQFTSCQNDSFSTSVFFLCPFNPLSVQTRGSEIG